jgi:hypothetical protein
MEPSKTKRNQIRRLGSAVVWAPPTSAVSLSTQPTVSSCDLARAPQELTLLGAPRDMSWNAATATCSNVVTGVGYELLTSLVGSVRRCSPTSETNQPFWTRRGQPQGMENHGRTTPPF